MLVQLEKEFQDLITKICVEVMELSITKSIPNTSEIMEEHAPEMERNIQSLNEALHSLYNINSNLSDHIKNHTERDQSLNDKLISLDRFFCAEFKKTYDNVLSLKNELANSVNT
ncbi:MAG: hypothetical protein K0R71_2172 [Bacillales bacterium]|nr:hypothetical protein [Bacillales bacterium]